MKAAEWTEPRAATDEEVLRWPDVHRIVKLSRTTVQKLEKLGKFPRRIRLTDYSIGWLRSDVAAWMASRRSTTTPAAERIA